MARKPVCSDDRKAVSKSETIQPPIYLREWRRLAEPPFFPEDFQAQSSVGFVTGLDWLRRLLKNPEGRESGHDDDGMRGNRPETGDRRSWWATRPPCTAIVIARWG